MLFVILQMLAGQLGKALPAAGASLVDVNGVTITLGATVKFVGVVTAIYPTDPHYGTIEVSALHPNGLPVIFDRHYGNAQSPNYLPGNPQHGFKKTGFEAIELVVGS